MKYIPKRFWKELSELRKRKGKTLLEASIITGYSVASLSQYENDKAEPSMDKQAGILDRLGRSK